MTEPKDKWLLRITERGDGIPGYLGVPDGSAPATEAPSYDQNAEWSTTIINQEKARIARDILAVFDHESEKAALSWILKNVGRHETSESSIEKLRSFIYAVSALEFNHIYGGLTRPQCDHLGEVAEGLLRTQGISPSSSKISFLYGDLTLARARQDQKRGKPHSTLLAQQLAHYLGKRQPTGGMGFQAIAAALRCLRLGHTGLAVTGLEIAELSPLSPFHFELARLARITAYRLRGEMMRTADLIRETAAVGELSDEARTELEWERMLSECNQSQDFSPVFSKTMRGKIHYHPSYLLEAHLWARALNTAAFVKRLPKVATIRKMAGNVLGRQTPMAFLFDCVQTIDRCYDNDIPLEIRLKGMQEVLPRLGRLLTIDKELLARLAIARWFTRYHQNVLAAAVIADYHATCMTLSEGRSRDVLGAADGLEADPWARFVPANRMTAYTGTQESDQLVTSVIGRAFEVSKISLAVAGKIAKGKIQSLGADSARMDAIQAERAAAIGDILIEHLGKLKGPLMKVAQAFSYLPSNMPEELKQRLATLTESAMPMSGNVTQRIVEEEFRQPIHALFAEWENAPFAAGSMGQVHRARLHTGEPVAVKVRYPDIIQMVEGDIRTIRMFAPLTKKIFPGFDIKAIIEEYRRMLLLETDYRNEAAFQAEFANIFRNDPRIVIPRVYPQFTTTQVITTDYVEGRTFRQFIADSTQEERNRVAETIFYMTYKAIFQHGVFNADPHPGNYLFTDDKVIFLDFGFSKRWSERILSYMRNLHLTIMRDDRAAFIKAFTSVGWVADPDAYDFDYAYRLARDHTVAPFREDRTFRYTHEHIRREIEASVMNNPNLKKTAYPIELTVIDRITWGLNSILANLDAEANWHRILNAILQVDPDDIHLDPAG